MYDKEGLCQRHVHEAQGSVMAADLPEEAHTHRFAAVSGEEVPFGEGHVHDIRFTTDYHENHYHKFAGTTGLNMEAGDRHIHTLGSVTTINESHRHEFRLVTQIEDPSGD